MEILIVEGNPAEAELTKELLERAESDVSVTVVENGDMGVEYMGFCGKKPGTAKPHMIFVNLNMPRMDGRKFVKYVKSRREWKDIPIVILTTSDAQKEVLRRYQIGDGFLKKPADFEEYSKSLCNLENMLLKRGPRSVSEGINVLRRKEEGD